MRTIADFIDEIKKNGATKVVETAIESAKEDTHNAFLQVFENEAIAGAKQVDEDIKAGKKLGKLAGVPFAVKDNFLTTVGQTTAASNILKGYRSPYSATSVQKLESEGAILIGKTNLDAFAHGSSTENSDYGVTTNPCDTSRVPGGSSGGSAAAVSLGIVPFALGTDTGGSIRLPASFTGVVGLKPSYGAVSRYGVVAMASSTDCIGPLTVCVEDAQIVLDIIKGVDPRDSTTVEIEPPSEQVATKRLGVIREFTQDLNDEVKLAFESALTKLKGNGFEIVEVSLSTADFVLPCYYTIVPAEISSNLARYDGLRYGPQSDEIDLQSQITTNRSVGFGKENIRRILMGNYVLSSGYYDAYYKKAQRLRTKLIQELKKISNGLDGLISPTAPFTAYKIGEKISDPITTYLADIMTVSASLSGVPAMSIPISLKKDDLPVGLQIIGSQNQDLSMLKLSQEIERII